MTDLLDYENDEEQQLEYSSSGQEDLDSKENVLTKLSLNFKKNYMPDPVIESSLNHCNVCDVYFIFEKTFLKHCILHQYDFKNVVDVRQKIECKCCGIFLGSVIDYNQHLYAHEDVAEIIQASEEEQSSPQSENMRDKIPVANLTRNHITMDYHCLYCPKRFSKKQSLTAHLVCHEIERPFQCKICFKRFKRKNNWKEHLDTHETELKFACDLCDRKFISKRYLRSHSYNHRKKGTLICPVKGCSKNFASKNALEQHIADLIKCLECDDTLHNIDELASHQAKRHEEKNCADCGENFPSEKLFIEHQLTCHNNTEELE